MNSEKLEKITAELKEKYPDVGIESISVNDEAGTSTFILQPTKKSLAFLNNPVIGNVVPKVFKERSSVIDRTALSQNYLDLSAGKNVYEDTHENIIKKASKYYYTEPLVGSTINLLSSLASKGFENDIDDENIKKFYDAWTHDVGFHELLEWIFLDFFKVGNVFTFKVVSKYEPKVSYMNAAEKKEIARIKELSRKQDEEYEKELKYLVESKKYKTLKAAKKNTWSKNYLPVAYTVLNPELVSVDGSLLFDKKSYSLKIPKELKDLIEKPAGELTEDEKIILKALPSELKAAVKESKPYVLDSKLVGNISYRKQPYERYAKPRTGRIFEAIEYQKSLKEADLSTLDGITNYILKITIGNDEYPVTSQGELEAVANLFNTPSKSFSVVWNHTLKVEKIISPEIENILGEDKYKQVNNEITAGLSIPRAIIDGVGEVSTAEMEMLLKGLGEEISYARRQVTRWIYREYAQIAEALNFKKYPKIRWDDSILKDSILFMTVIAQFLDRRAISYKTALEAIGFDYTNELKNMENELSMVQDGVFGLFGSPFQNSKQPNQEAPKGTPSSGRPPGTTKQKVKDTNTTKKTKAPKPKKANSVKDMTDVEYAMFLKGVSEILTEEQYIKFVEELDR